MGARLGSWLQRGLGTLAAALMLVSASGAAASAALLQTEIPSPVDGAVLIAPAPGATIFGISTLSAASLGPEVQFSVDGVAVGTVPADAGSAHLDLDTQAFANGTHTLAAAPCDITGCGQSSPDVVVTFDNALPSGENVVPLTLLAPQITSPRNGRAIGLPTMVKADAPGGNVRFSIGGRKVAIDRRPPYAFRLDPQAMEDGWHTITARTCDPVGDRCLGGASSIRVRTSRHPRITAPAADAEVRNTVTLRAASPAPRVRFSLDGRWLGPPERTVDGVAVTTWRTFGYRDGPHRIRAHACGKWCVPASGAVDVTLDSVVPVVTSPPQDARIGDRVTVRVRAPRGAGIRFEIDGDVVGFDNDRGHSMTWNTSRVPEGSAHGVRARLCSRDGRRCSGPLSDTRRVLKQRLHPVVRELGPGPFSPNGDGIRDEAKLRFSLSEPQRVRVTILDASGRVVRGPLRIGRGDLDRGTHGFTWNGRNNGGSRVRTGWYRVALDTARSAYGGTRVGHAHARIAVDVRRPRLSALTGSGDYFYPEVDGERDDFTPTVLVDEPASVSLRVFDARGQQLAVIADTARGAGHHALTWSGRRSDGSPYPNGRYTFVFHARDLAGNTQTSSIGSVTVATKPPEYVWPRCDEVTSPFGYRWGRMHEGLDINGETGDGIYASRGGVVSFAGYDSGYGNMILIDHGNGVVTAYAHQTGFAVGLGDAVAQGRLIGYVGSTGYSTGSHLHFETRVNGQAVDPMGLLPPSC